VQTQRVLDHALCSFEAFAPRLVQIKCAGSQSVCHGELKTAAIVQTQQVSAHALCSFEAFLLIWGLFAHLRPFRPFEAFFALPSANRICRT